MIRLSTSRSAGRRLRALLLATALACAQDGAAAQGSQREAVQEHFDTVKEVAGTVAAVFPPAAIVSGVFDSTFAVLDFFGYFGSSAPGGGDKYMAAIDHLQKQIDALDARMTRAENRLKDHAFRIVENENRSKIDKIAELHKDAVAYLGDIKLGIQRKDAALIDKAIRASLANADRFLASGGQDIWAWSDQPTGASLGQARFNPNPALPHYLMQLQAVALGIEALDRPVAMKVRDYARHLEPHIAMLTGRNARGDELANLPRMPLAERIQRAIACPWSYVQALGQTVPKCQDAIAQANPEPFYGPPSKPVENPAFERALEDVYGVQSIEDVASVLSRLATRGYVNQTYTSFGASTAVGQTWLYARTADGSLVRYFHTISTPAPPTQAEKDRTAGASVVVPPAVMQAPAAPLNRNPAVTQQPVPLVGPPVTNAPRDVAAPPPAVINAAPNYVHDLSTGHVIATGWDRCQKIFPMTATAGVGFGRQAGHLVYCMRDDGALLWSQHQAAQNYEKLSPMKQVGTGWSETGTSFRELIGGGDGIFYAVAPDGRLTWQRHENAFAMPTAYAKWTGHRPVGTGWHIFKDVFSGGRGILYAIEPGGSLRWYDNTGYPTGAQQWTGPKTVGSGWANFRAVLSAGEGDLYAVNQAGDLLWYRHLGWKDGATSWLGPVKLASGWDRFEVVGARIAPTPVNDPTGGVH